MMATATPEPNLIYDQPGVRFVEDGHRYFVTLPGQDEVRWPSVTEVLEVAGLVDDYAGVPAPVLYRAGRRGTAIHKALPLLLDGTLDWMTVDDQIVGQVEQLALALDRLKVHAWNCEQPIYSERLRITGTPDLWCASLCRPTVIDVKSGKKTPLSVDAARLQMALYALMIREALPGGEVSHIERIALWLTPTGYEPQRFDKSLQDELDAEAAARVAWRRAHQRTKGVWTP
jgi:hypothetical protein